VFQESCWSVCRHTDGKRVANPRDVLVNEGTSAKSILRPDLRVSVGTAEAAETLRKIVIKRIFVGGAWNVQPTGIC
jgi:hypothetical protein